MMFSLWVSILFYHKVFVYTPHTYAYGVNIHPICAKGVTALFKGAIYNTGVK